MKWSREDYIKLMTYGDVKNKMFVELFGPLVGLEDEWIKQGATEEEINMKAFDWDYVSVMDCGGNLGLRGGFTPKTIEETSEYVIRYDELGRKTKLCKGIATIAMPLDYPVTDMESWLKIKPFYEFHEDRINWKQVDAAIKAQESGTLIGAWMLGGFDLPRELMGEEGACLCYYEQPELMKDILQTIGDTAVKVMDKINKKLTIDNLMVHEDMAGKSGSLIGPNLIAEFIKPYYRRIWDILHARGTKLFSQDSDGNMKSVIESFLECGVNIMYPIEPAAGMDIVELRKKYGKRLAFKGGINKHILRGTKDEIKSELEYKMQPLMQEGGVVFGIDHRITNGTSLENYKYYVSLGRELLGIPTLKQDKTGWERMAF